MLMISHLTRRQELILTRAGISVCALTNFGGAAQTIKTLLDAKELIRCGKVVWVHGEIRLAHFRNPTGVTQCFRPAHRAGAQWSLTSHVSTWRRKSFEALRRHKHVQTHVVTSAGTPIWVTSERANLEAISREVLVKQVAAYQGLAASGKAARWVGELKAHGEETKRQIQQTEDTEAVGGVQSCLSS